MKESIFQKLKLHKRADEKAPYSSITFVFDNTGTINHCKIDKEIVKDQERINELKSIITNI